MDNNCPHCYHPKHFPGRCDKFVEVVWEGTDWDEPCSCCMPVSPPSEQRQCVKLEKKYRALLWLSHGHSISMMYGDDGEMQCHPCAKDGNSGDYLRCPLEEAERMHNSAKLELLRKIENG